MDNEINRWVETAPITVSRLLEVMDACCPEGRGVSRRTLFNARLNGTMDTRTLVLLIAASEVLTRSGEVPKPLSLSDFDQWGFLERGRALSIA